MSNPSSPLYDPVPENVDVIVRTVPFHPESSLARFAELLEEVFSLIANHLSARDLAVCLRVSKGYRHIWEDYLFRYVNLTDEDQSASFELAKKHFKRHSKLTRSFASCRGFDHGRLLRRSGCSSLRRLDLRFRLSATILPADMMDLLGALTSTNAYLDLVSLTGQFDWTLALDLISKCTVLSRLKLDFLEADPVDVPSQSCGGSSVRTKELGSLKQLSLAGLRISNRCLLVLLRECPNLRAIRFRMVGAWEPSAATKKELVERLKTVGSLTWEANEVDEEELGEMLALGTETKRVAIFARTVSSFAPLVERAATLRSLTLDGIRGSFGSELQLFLERATVLRQLFALPSAQFDNNHVRLLARNFHDRTGEMAMLDSLAGATAIWGCALTLTRLEVAIERLHPTYVDTTDDAVYGNTLPMSVECTTEHMVAYQQLGKLVNLQHLRLGQQRAPESVDGGEELGGYQTNCLLFSDESGIDPLSGMRAIRTLDVRWTAHEIGQVELRWMKINWPRLDVVRGLTDLPPRAGRLQRERCENAETWIRAHPRGVGKDFYRQ